MKWSDFDDYLTADHLTGKAFTLQIRDLKLEDILDHDSRRQELKPVLYFNGTDKGLVLTSSNRKTLKGLFGDDVSACIGKHVTLRAERVFASGKERSPIRIVAATATNQLTLSDAFLDWAREYEIPQHALQCALDQAGGDYDEAQAILERAYVLKAA